MKTNLLCLALASSLTFSGVSAPNVELCYGPASDFAVMIDVVAKATEFKEKQDFAGGEAYIAAECAKLQSPTREQSQALDMAKFALYRDDSSKNEEMEALLNKVLTLGETTFWGTSALGWLHVRNKAPITVYWPWWKGQLVSPETTIVYGVDKAFEAAGNYTITITGDSPLKINAVALIRADGSESRITPKTSLPRVTIFEAEVSANSVKSIRVYPEGNNLPGGKIDIKRQIVRSRGYVDMTPVEGLHTDAATYIRRVVGEKTLEQIAKKDGGARFLQRFFNDNDWMEQFAGSGPFSCAPRLGTVSSDSNAAKALLALDMLVFNDKDDFILGTNIGRNLATALALNHGAEKSEEWLVEVLACYREWVKDGSLIPECKNYDTRQWREVVGFGQNLGLSVEDLKWCHNFAKPTNTEGYAWMCWQCSYRTFNCFGEDVQGPHYYRVWEHRMKMQEMRYYVGGVCGALSKFGSHIAAAHGVRTFTAGQPAHCAYVLWDTTKHRWTIAYSVTGHTMPHNSLGGIGFAAICEQERYYSHPRRMEAERLRWRGEYEKAMRIVPGNWLAGVEWLNSLDKRHGSPQEWDTYGKTVRETFRDMPSEAYQLYIPYITSLSTIKERLAAAKEALLTIVENPNDEVEAAYFDEIVLTPLRTLFAKNPEVIWELFDAALDGQAATKTFYRQTVNWGAIELIKDENSSRLCMEAIGRSVRKTGAKLDYRDMIITASKYGDQEMWNQVYALMDKCSPELKTTPNGRVWPTVKCGVPLLSQDGMLMTSSTSGWDWPISYRDALNVEGHHELSSFHPGREKAPWGMVKLPGPAQVKAITIVNSGAGGNAARQIPLVVWTSEDGKNFTKLATFNEVKDEWNIELAQPVKARYVKVGREPDAKTEVFHLHKILVYGKKLY